MILIKRSVYDDPEFMALVEELDEDLKRRYPAYQERFINLNLLDKATKVVIAFYGGKAVACGALRPITENGTVELKRMFVQPVFRGKGISKQILRALELWASEEGYNFIRLETGKNQPEAIALYQTAGYSVTPAFGGYAHIEEAICMIKTLV